MFSSWFATIAWFSSLSTLIAAQSNPPADDPYTCSATKPCALGCCSKGGVCGLGPTFCAPANCQSSCDQKSECDPGWGMQWSQAKTCPLNVCCSKFGFCGTTQDFCGDNKVTAPSCPISQSTSNKRTIGYYESWSTTRTCDKMYPEGIPAGAYSHLNFAFAFVDPTSFQVAPMSETDQELYTRITALKDINPGLQVWISIGGWSMNDPDQPTHSIFSDLAGSTAAQSQFFSSLLSLMSTYGFDGVDIDWEYPVAPERSGKPQDYQNYVSFLSNLRAALGSSGHPYGLSITIPSSYWYLRNFDIVSIAQQIDWFNLMTYDLHGTWDSTDKYIGAVVNAHTNLTEIDQTLDLLWRNNIDPDKVVLGLGFYGRSFTLSDPSCTHAGCPFKSGGNPGECSASAGTLTFAEIKRIVAAGGTETLVQDAAVKQVVFGGDQWVSYDDADTFKMKIDYANSKCLGGTMIWAASTDDAVGTAAAALSRNTGRNDISNLAVVKPDNIGTCVWGECGQDCPPDMAPAQRGDKGGVGNAGIYNNCPDHGTRNFCCPKDDVPTCQWRGTAPFCRDAKCEDGEVEVTSDGSGTGKSCWFNHKVLCCKSTTSDEAIGKCQWKGSAPICSIISGGHASCPANTAELTYSRSGAGGEAECSNGYKSLCCSQPPPYKNCNWQRHDNSWNFGIPFFCATQCPAGKTPIASDTEFCITGASLFCCDAPARSPDPAESTVHNYLQSFHDNPTCSGTRALSKRDALVDSNDLDDDFTDSDVNRTAIDAAFATLKQRQSTKLTRTQEIALMSALTTAFISLRSGAQTQLSSSITQDFDQIVGPVLGLTSQSFISVYDLFPAYDPRQVTEGVLCQGQNAGRVPGTQQSVNTCACQLPSGIRPGANNPPPFSPHLSKRVIAWGWDSIGGTGDHTTAPDLYRMIAGIINGQLQFMYTRLIRYAPEADGIVEMAWRIPAGQQNNIYRYVPEDQFFVLHAHTNHMLVTQEGGPRYVGVYQIGSFHGQQWDYDNNRVNGRPTNTQSGNNDNNNYQDNLTGRTEVMACVEFPARQYFYPGAPNSRPTDPDCDPIVSQLGDYLRLHGILDGRSLDIVGGNLEPDADGFIEDLAWDILFRGEGPSRDANHNPYHFPG